MTAAWDARAVAELGILASDDVGHPSAEEGEAAKPDTDRSRRQTFGVHDSGESFEAFTAKARRRGRATPLRASERARVRACARASVRACERASVAAVPC